MADPIEVVGGNFVAPEAWCAAIRGAGFRIELDPGADARLGGELVLRLGHPSIAGDRDVVVTIDIRYFALPRAVPEHVVTHRRARLAALRAANVASIVVVQEEIVVAWITGGAPAVVDAIVRLELDGEEWQRELAYWKRPDATLPASTLFWSSGPHTRGHLIADWLVAAGYARSGGGDLRLPGGDELVPGADALSAEQIAATVSEVDRGIELLGDAAEADVIFDSW